MSSEFSKDRMTLTSTKDQENNKQTDSKMRKRSREDGDVAGSARTKIQGRSSINNSSNNVPDLSKNAQEGVSVKKTSAADGEMKRKRFRCSNLNSLTNHDEGPVEDTSIKGGKRKASVDAGPPEKKTRCSINNTNPTEPSVSLVEDHPVEPKKRKARDDDEAPERKRTRCSNSSSSSNDSNNSSSSSFKEREDLSSDDDGDDISQNFGSASTEEETIYKMSSSSQRSRAGFEKKYCQLEPLGEGGFGSVYAGFRKSDNLPVAIKRIPSEAVRCEQVTCNGKVFDIIVEVALMLKAAGLPGSVGQSAAVSLLDWYILKDESELVLVMEKPAQSMDLNEYLKSRGGSLDEREAKVILKQLVDAAIDMHSKGVFHRDIKLHNVLIQLDSDVPRVRIIDFGCGTFSTDMAYSSLCGTPAIFPPEWFDSQSYWASSTTVWQLGALFYSLLNGHERFTTKAFIKNHIQINHALSTPVKILLSMCLARKPSFRITLENLKHNFIFRQL